MRVCACACYLDLLSLGCKIKALRAKTGTYIKTPARGDPPIFIVTGKHTDVQTAKAEILQAADHFTTIRASRNGAAARTGSNGPMNLSEAVVNGVARGEDSVTRHVKVPYSVVGLIVGPRGSTIKKIQSMTRTYIVTPSRDKEPVFEIQGAPDCVAAARVEINSYINQRVRPGHDNPGSQHSLQSASDMYYEGAGYEGSHRGSTSALGGGGAALANAVDTTVSHRGMARNIWSPSGPGDRQNGVMNPFAPMYGVSESHEPAGRRTSTGTNLWSGDSASRENRHRPLSGTRSDPLGGNYLGNFGTSGSEASYMIGGNPTQGTEPLSSWLGAIGSARSLNSSTGSSPDAFDLGTLDFDRPSRSQPGSSGASSPPVINSHRLTPGRSQPERGDASSPPLTAMGALSLAPGSSAAKKCSNCHEDREMDFALVPCGHNLFCQQCATRFEANGERCPACGQSVSKVLRLLNT